MKVISRAEAKRLGLSHYYTGKECPKGHLSRRAVNSCACLECQKECTAASRTSNPGICAAESMFRHIRRKYPNAIVSGVTVADVMPFYSKAAKLTARGVPYEVDHITPLSSGGKHHPANLRVITRTENRSRPKSSRPYTAELESRLKELERALEEEQHMRRLGDEMIDLLRIKYIEPAAAQVKREQGTVYSRIMSGKEQILQQKLH